MFFSNSNKFSWLTDSASSFKLTVEELDKLQQLFFPNDHSFDQSLTEIKQTLAQSGSMPWGPLEPQEKNFLLSHDPVDWIPYLDYRFKFRMYPLRKIVADFPVYVLVEPTSVCNLRCTVCFQVDSSFTKKPFMGHMKLNDFKRIVEELEEGGTRALTLASRGEPTLNPNLGEMLEVASRESFFDLKLNTNATKLTEKLCHQILSSRVNELVFSVDSHDPKIYEEIRVNAKFDNVLHNIEMFRDIRSKYYRHSILNTRVSGVKFRPDQDPAGFVSFWSERVDDVGYVEMEDRWDTYNNQLRPELTQPCNYLWERLYVWQNLQCNPCDVDYKSLLSTGDLNTSTIREVWHGPLYQKLRENHLAGERSKHNPCDRCGI